MNLFYVPGLTGKIIQLNTEESRHCIKVLRLRKGDHVQLLNGIGSQFEAMIIDPNAKSCILEVLTKEEKPSKWDYFLTIAIAPTKNMDRFEWFAEKSTEIGIDQIIPLICKHSERRALKSDRIEKILISAMKQSGQVYLPVFKQSITFMDLVSQPFDGDKLIAHCGYGEKRELKDTITPGKNVLILIGPEGDFDSEEINFAVTMGFVPISLGKTRLRTETAGLVACHTVCLVNQK